MRKHNPIIVDIKPQYSGWKKFFMVKLPEHWIMVSSLIFGMILVFTAVAMSSGDRQFLPNIITMPIYDHLANYDANTEPRVIEIAEFCNGFKNVEMVECVTSQINYTYSERWGVDVKTLTDMEQNGGICKDIAVSTGAIMKRMGYYVDFRFLPNHVYLTVSDENSTFYCNVDGVTYHCYGGED